MISFSAKMDDDADVEKQNRVLLRPWLENMLENQNIPGLKWFDVEKTMFKVPWKHRSKKDWSLRHSSVFLEWAKNTGRWSEGDPAPDFAQLKTRLRCAFNKAPDIDEMKEYHCSEGEEPYKVYRFNTRRGDIKSVFGRKTNQKTISRQGNRSGSPTVLKYESCEEEVVDDDDAIYGEIEIHSSAFSSGESISGFRKIETEKNEMGQEIYMPAVSGTDTTWNYEGYVPQIKIKDSKSPVIPLTVEMMTSSSINDDSDCDGESPKNQWHDSADQNVSVAAVDDVLQTTVKSKVLPGSIHQIKTTEMQKQMSDDSADKMHLLQMASLFVEAAERKKEKEIQLDEKTPEPIMVSTDAALSQYHPNQYMIIMPSHCEMENQNEGNITSGYVTPTSTEVIDVKLQLEEPKSCKTSADKDFVEEEEEAVDLTKPAIIMKNSATSEDLQANGRVVGQIQPVGYHGSRNTETAQIHLSLHNTTDGTMFGTQLTSDMPMLLSEQATIDEIKRSLNKLSERSGQLMEWENRLRSWENHLRSWESQLQAKEETLYWRDRCLKSELVINSTNAKQTQIFHRSRELNVSGGSSVLTSTSSKQSTRLKDRPALTSLAASSSICSSAITSTRVLNSVVINKEPLPSSLVTKDKTESQLKRNCIPGNKGISLSHSVNQVTDNLCPNLTKETNGGLNSDQVILSNSLGLSSTVSSVNYVHSVPVMSLIASNQGVPLIFPVLSGSQTMMFLPQHLVPVAPIHSVNSDGGILLRNCLENQSTVKGTTANCEFVKVQSEQAPLSNAVNGILAGKYSLGEKIMILPTQHDADKSLHSNEGNSCSQISDVDSLILESTLEKSEEAVTVDSGKEANRKDKTTVSDVDCKSKNMNNEGNCDFQPFDSDSQESSKGLRANSHDISVSRIAQKVTNSINDAATFAVASSDHHNEQSVSKNCQSVGSVSSKSEPRADVFPKVLPKILISFPQINEPVSDGQTTAWPCSKSHNDFTDWLRAKTEIICKEESLEGKKSMEETLDPSQECFERNEILCSSKSELKVQTENQDESVNHLHYDLNLLSTSDKSVLGTSSPVLTPQVPLVVEHENNFLEKDCGDDIVSKSSSFSGSNLVKRRKRNFEKQNSFKKVRIDA